MSLLVPPIFGFVGHMHKWLKGVGAAVLAAGGFLASQGGPFGLVATSSKTGEAGMSAAARALYPLIAKTVGGETYAFEAMRGKVGLVTNVASF